MTDFSTLVKQKRNSFGMSQKDFAALLGLNDNGERTVRGHGSVIALAGPQTCSGNPENGNPLQTQRKPREPADH